MSLPLICHVYSSASTAAHGQGHGARALAASGVLVLTIARHLLLGQSKVRSLCTRCLGSEEAPALYPPCFPALLNVPGRCPWQGWGENMPQGQL